MKLIENKYTVLSFDIDIDYSFDQEINKKNKSRIKWFDTFLETKLFQDISIENHSKDYKTKSSLRLIKPLQKFKKCFLLFIRF